MTDISENEYYFCELINVIKFSHRTLKHLKNNGRHSDGFVYITSGSCSYKFTDGTGFTVKKGDILYLAQNAVYDMYIHSDEYAFIYCDFRFSENANRKCAVYSPESISETEAVFRHLHRCYTKPDVNYFSECMADLYKIQSIIVKSAKRKYTKDSKSKISAAVAYIDSNCSNSNLSISQLAEMSGMSEVHFRKLFKNMCNISPINYITYRRIEKAKSLLVYPFITISECARQCGFESGQYFSRVFKTHTGLTPSEYRRKY